MMTVKLRRGHVTKIIEAVRVDIFPCGRVPGSDSDPSLRTNEVREISVHTHAGSQEVFYVSDHPKTLEDGPVPPEDTWEQAFIENAHGATTEIVRPY